MNIEQIILADEYEKAGYLSHIRKLAMIPTATLFWSTGIREGGSQIIANGTIFFLLINEKIIGITNYHVYKSYLASKGIFHDIEF